MASGRARRWRRARGDVVQRLVPADRLELAAPLGPTRLVAARCSTLGVVGALGVAATPWCTARRGWVGGRGSPCTRTPSARPSFHRGDAAARRCRGSRAGRPAAATSAHPPAWRRCRWPPRPSAVFRPVHRGRGAAPAVQPPDFSCARFVLRRNRAHRAPAHQPGLKKIAVFYQNDAYGKAGLDGVTKALADQKLKPRGHGHGGAQLGRRGRRRGQAGGRHARRRGADQRLQGPAPPLCALRARRALAARSTTCRS
jgi:hypothetical protein